MLSIRALKLTIVVALLLASLAQSGISSAGEATITGHVMGVGACPSDPCPHNELFYVRVVLDDAAGERVASKLAKVDGSFSFSVPPGPYTIEARSVLGYISRAPKEIEVARYQDGPRRVPLREDATSVPGVVGQATKSPTCGGPQREGQTCTAPMDGAQIHIEDSNGTTVATQTTGRNGYYAFELPPGTYDLVAEGTGSDSNLPAPPGPKRFTVGSSDVGPHHIDSDYDTGIR
ncbi:MAG: SdrD B-like domain [Actinomycetota bacterium]|jgi:hypothetical protein|nr:SdrD B-like domain [Actinomycetota bacterium]